MGSEVGGLWKVDGQRGESECVIAERGSRLRSEFLVDCMEIGIFCADRYRVSSSGQQVGRDPMQVVVEARCCRNQFNQSVHGI
jgi:hypothetical protein